MIPTGENRGTGIETCHSATVCTTNTTQTGLGSTRTYAVTYCMSRTFIQLTKSLGSDYARCWTVQGSNPGRENNFSRLQTVAYRGGLGCSTPHPRNSEGPPKACQTQPHCETLNIAEFRAPTPQDVRKKGSKILKLCSQLFYISNDIKLVVIISSLKVPKTKKILLYEMKFFVPNYSCLHNP